MFIPLNKPAPELMVDLVNVTNNTNFTIDDIEIVSIVANENPEFPGTDTAVTLRGTGTTSFVGPETLQYTRLDLDYLTLARNRVFELPLTATAEEVLGEFNGRFELGLTLDELGPINIDQLNGDTALYPNDGHPVYRNGVIVSIQPPPVIPWETSFVIDPPEAIWRFLTAGWLTYTIHVPTDGAANGVEFTINDLSTEDPGRFMVHYGPTHTGEPGMNPWTRPEWLIWGTHLADMGMDPDTGGEIPVAAGGGFSFRLQDDLPAGTYVIQSPLSYHGSSEGPLYELSVTYKNPLTQEPVDQRDTVRFIPFEPPTAVVEVTPAIVPPNGMVHVKITTTIKPPMLPDGGYLLINVNDSVARSSNHVCPPDWTVRVDDPEVNRSYVYFDGLASREAAGEYIVEFDLQVNPTLFPDDESPITAWFFSNTWFGQWVMGTGKYTIGDATPPEDEDMYYKFLPQSVELDSVNAGDDMVIKVGSSCGYPYLILSSDVNDSVAISANDFDNVTVSKVSLYSLGKGDNHAGSDRAYYNITPAAVFERPVFTDGFAPVLLKEHGPEALVASNSDHFKLEVKGGWRDTHATLVNDPEYTGMLLVKAELAVASSGITNKPMYLLMSIPAPAAV